MGNASPGCDVSTDHFGANSTGGIYGKSLSCGGDDALAKCMGDDPYVSTLRIMGDLCRAKAPKVNDQILRI